MKSIKAFESVVSAAIKNGIRTNEDLKNSKYFEPYCLACFAVSKEYARMTHEKNNLPKELKVWDNEDISEELCIFLITKFHTITDAVLNPEKDEAENSKKHNHKSYIMTAFSNKLAESVRKYMEKEEIVNEKTNRRNRVNATKIDEFGNTTNVYIRTTSLSTPVSETGDITLGDTLSNESRSAGNDIDALLNKMEYLEWLKSVYSKHTYIGQVYVLINDILSAYRLSSSLQSMLEMFEGIEEKTAEERRLVESALIRAFNEDLYRCVYLLNNGMSDKEAEYILTHYARSYNEFGRNFVLTRDKVYHLRSLNLDDIIEFTGYQRPVKRRSHS